MLRLRNALTGVMATVLPLCAQTAFTVPAGTAVRLRLAETVSSANAAAGTPVRFEVADDLIANSVVVVPRGTVVTGTVSAVHVHSAAGKGSSLQIKLDAFRAGAGLRIPIGTTAPAVAPPVTAMMAGTVPIPVLPPAPSPLLFSTTGAAVSIPKGLEVVVYTERPLTANSNKLAAKAAAATASRTSPAIASVPLTNEDILSMKRAGIADDQILARVTSAPGAYRLDPADLAVLKKAHVSEAVLQAMVAQMQR